MFILELVLMVFAIMPITYIVDVSSRGAIVSDWEGNLVDRIKSGEQIVLAVEFQNHSNLSQPFIGLIEVRNDAGITIFLGWQTGTLKTDGHTGFAMSWIPTQAGDYQIRQFALSNLENPVVLDQVIATNISVYD